MPRRARVVKREVRPDARYGNRVIAKFIAKIMQRGKKSLAEQIMYRAMDTVGQRTGREPLEVFEQAMRNATPILEVKPRRVGGATYQVPVEIKGDRRISLAIRWLLAASRTRSGKSMADKLAAEILDASNNIGTTIKRREDTHRMAEANKAFSHYRW